jgi:hypothetical protein
LGRLSASAVLVALAARTKKAPEISRQAIDVTAMTVSERGSPVDLEFTVQTRSSREVEVRARVDGILDGQFMNPFTGPSKGVVVCGSVTAPIFTAGNISGQIRQAEAQQQQALFEYRKATVFTSMVDLNKAMGGGWVTDAERMTATMYGANGRLVGPQAPTPAQGPLP